jgi:hypothetical protein
VDDVVRVFERLSEHETAYARPRKLTLIVPSSAELVEQLRSLPERWLIQSISRQQKRFVVRLIRLEF